MAREFDRKFGDAFLATVPTDPGVYRFLDKDGTTIYVGKAKSLRRRLAQYRLSKRKRKDRRQRKIVAAAATITWEITETDLDACLLEVRLIQKLQPKLNVASAFSFLYPYLGVALDNGKLRIGYTTTASALPAHTLFGAFRSRDVCKEAYFSLLRLLSLVGHREPKRKGDPKPLARHTHDVAFRRVPDDWNDAWRKFFRGESRVALESLAVALLDSPDARARARLIEEDLAALAVFFETEAKPLGRAISATLYEGAYPIPQSERDPLFLRFRALSIPSP